MATESMGSGSSTPDNGGCARRPRVGGPRSHSILGLPTARRSSGAFRDGCRAAHPYAILEAVVIAVLGVLVFGLLRSHADLARSLHRLGAGEDSETATVPLRTRPGVPPPRAEATATADLSGRRPGGGGGEGGCRRCRAPDAARLPQQRVCYLCRVLEGVRRGAAHPGGRPSGGGDQGPRSRERIHGRRTRSPRCHHRHVERGVRPLRVPVAPYFILVDGPSGRVAGEEGAAASWRQMVSLLERAAPTI